LLVALLTVPQVVHLGLIATVTGANTCLPSFVVPTSLITMELIVPSPSNATLVNCWVDIEPATVMPGALSAAAPII